MTAAQAIWGFAAIVILCFVGLATYLAISFSSNVDDDENDEHEEGGI